MDGERFPLLLSSNKKSLISFLFLCYNDVTENEAQKELLSWKIWILEGGSRNTARLPE